jgi:hypothetical protein
MLQTLLTPEEILYLRSQNESRQEEFLRRIPSHQLQSVILQLKGSPQPQPQAKESAQRVKEHRERAREIGEIPPVSDPVLRAECDASLAVFLKSCFPDIFTLTFSRSHEDLIESIERVITNGGNEAFACERGFGKTQLSVGAINWGALTGRSKYSLIIGANAEMATAQRDGIKRRLETSDTLLALYPEICYPMRVLAGSLKMSATHHGKLLRIKSRPDLVLPCVDGAPGSEAVISCTGIDSGSIRGRYYDRADGTTVRPDTVMLDDPQDDTTAKQPKEVENRSKKIRQAVMGLAGPGKKIAIMMPCTVIAKNDLAFEFTDRNIRPEWSGKRVRAMPAMPVDLDAEFPKWHVYDEIRREDLASGDKTRARATEYYLANQAEMADGAVITWPERIEKNCTDALQSLMDKYLGDRHCFMAEQQQDPVGDEDLTTYLSTTQIAQRFNGLRRQQIPPGAALITTGIDIQEHLLYWSQTVWSEALSGWIVDRGTFPRQPIADFHHLTPPRTITQWVAKEFPGQSFTWEEQHQLAIRACIDLLPKYRDLEQGPIVIDNRWHKAQSAVHQVASESDYAGTLAPAGGIAVGGNDTPISSRKMQEGNKRVSTDVEWYIKRVDKQTRIILFDANYYRSQLQKGLAKEPGSQGSITYNSTVADAVFAAHLGSKAMKRTPDAKRDIEIWTNKPGQSQDHWLDCCVMTRVGAEIAGYRAAGVRHVKRSYRKAPLTQSDIDAKRKGGR